MPENFNNLLKVTQISKLKKKKKLRKVCVGENKITFAFTCIFYERI